jgi:hypothetical protein
MHCFSDAFFLSFKEKISKSIPHIMKKENYRKELNTIRYSIFFSALLYFSILYLLNTLNITHFKQSTIISTTAVILLINLSILFNKYVYSIKIHEGFLFILRTNFFGKKSKIVISLQDLDKIKNRACKDDLYGNLWLHCTTAIISFKTIGLARKNKLYKQLNVEHL